MKLKRIYKKDDAGNVIFNDEAGNLIALKPSDSEKVFLVSEDDKRRAAAKPLVVGVIVQELPKNGKQHFTPNLVEGGQKEGWLVIDDNHITINDEFKFKIVGVPGRYCLHCGEKLIDDDKGTEARKHIAKHHADVDSPDENEPSGYTCNNYYACELEV